MTNPGPARPVNLEVALDHLADDGLVAFPTETVWGLAARACSPRAVARLTLFKGRASDQPISVLIDGAKAFATLGVAHTPLLDALIEEFWPGPLTLVVSGPADGFFAPGIGGASGAVGFRCSDHPVTSRLVAEAMGRELGPLTATSFNRSGETAVESLSEAMSLAQSSEDPVVLVLDPGGVDAFALPPSTVVDLSDEVPRVLRKGAVEAESLDAVLERFRDDSQRR